DFWVDVKVSATPEYRNAQGLLQDDGSATASNYSTVLPASYRRGDAKNLDKYVTSGITGWLTKRPLTENNLSTWCLDQEASLSIYFTQKKQTGTGQVIQLYVEQWPTVGGAYAETIELQKFQSGQITFSLNSIFNTIKATYPNVKQLRVQVGINAGTYVRKSEYAYLTLERNCCTGTTFSWLNELGGVDSYTFCGELETQFSVSNEYGQQYDDGITTRLKGIYKTSSEVGEVINVRDLLSAADLDWIKYILASHEVYVKIGSAWYNCVITDASAITESNIEGMYDFSFTARLSDVVVNHN
ncbi:MAG: hypothetical protein EBW87_06305, partial [Burkholderiaceae bacterium]|nr:hypothetical protein [Burkholderiaceae bacterium]